MIPEKTNEHGFTAEEQAEIDAAPEESDEADSKAEEAIEEDSPQEPLAKEPAPKGNGKPPAGYVPQGALSEARQQLKELKERDAKREQMLQQILSREAPAKQQKEEPHLPEIVPYDQDPLAHTKSQLDLALARITEMEKGYRTQSLAQQENARHQETLNRYGASMRAFAKTTPEFSQAYEYLAEQRDAELSVAGIDDPVERANRIQYDEGLLVGRAFNAGKNPAQVIYDLAIHRGFKPKESASDESKLDRLAKGERAAKALTGGKGPVGDISYAQLMDLTGEEFDRAWEKARKAGRLG